MKGVTKLFAYFLKIMTMVIIVAALIAVFMELAEFGSEMESVEKDRIIKIVADTVLSSDCLVEVANDDYPVKGLFNFQKVQDQISNNPNNPECIKIPNNILIKIEASSTYEIGNTSMDTTTAYSTKFPAAINLGNRVESASVTLYMS